MARTVCGVWVCDVTGSQWRRDWENPCSSCPRKESGECPGGIIEDADDESTEMRGDKMETTLDFDLIDPKTGVNYVLDFIGNYGDFLTLGEDGTYYFKNKDDYIWWKSAADRQNRIDEFIFACDDDAIIQDIYDAADGEVDLDILLDKQIAVIDAATI